MTEEKLHDALREVFAVAHISSKEAATKMVAILKPMMVTEDDEFQAWGFRLAAPAARTWNMDMAPAYRDRVIEVVGRLVHAATGFPRYATWTAQSNQWRDLLTQQELICWAWRARDEWPDEPK